MDRYMDLKKLSLDELAGVVNLYPWFGSARKELCVRMSEVGGVEWSRAHFAEAALYLPDRRVISEIMRTSLKEDCSDKDVSAVLKTYLSAEKTALPDKGTAVQETGGDFSRRSPQVRVAGGDYFSQTEYENVRKESDGIFSRFAAEVRQDTSASDHKVHEDLDFCTETLAQIYQEQGYYEHARHIYEKLILAYPEKNAYFAALIEKLKTDD